MSFPTTSVRASRYCALHYGIRAWLKTCHRKPQVAGGRPLPTLGAMWHLSLPARSPRWETVKRGFFLDQKKDVSLLLPQRLMEAVGTKRLKARLGVDVGWRAGCGTNCTYLNHGNSIASIR